MIKQNKKKKKEKNKVYVLPEAGHDIFYPIILNVPYCVSWTFSLGIAIDADANHYFLVRFF